MSWSEQTAERVSIASGSRPAASAGFAHLTDTLVEQVAGEPERVEPVAQPARRDERRRAVSADVDRHPTGPKRLREAAGTGEGEELTVEVASSSRHSTRMASMHSSARARGSSDRHEGLELFLEPADTDTDREAAGRQSVDRGQALGQLHGWCSGSTINPCPA